MRGLRFIVLIREDLKVEAVADEITKPALSPPGFSTRDLPQQSPILNQPSKHQPCFTVWQVVSKFKHAIQTSNSEGKEGKEL